MKQELGETTQAMQAADEKEIEAILNRRPHGQYWIVIHHKPTKMKLETGEMVLMRLVKDYDNKPEPLIGTIILEVNDGEITNCEVSPHDAPIEWSKIVPIAGFEEHPAAIFGNRASQGYVYNQ